jgi:hypothetical protein
MPIKSKVVKSTINNKDILATFQDILGTSDTNTCLPIAYPKYLRMKGSVSRFLKLLTVFRNSSIFEQFKEIKDSLSSYIESLDANFTELFVAPDLEHYFDKTKETLAGHNYESIPTDVKEEFSKVFTNVKKCNVINIIIVTCKNLIPYKKYIADKNELSDTFLTKTAGSMMNPLPEITLLNIKRIYNDTILTQSDKKFILMFLSKLYEISYNTYEVVTSPDVDVNDFVTIIVNSIDELKKHIPRCDDAFNKIVESVDILKYNFDSYYKDFVASNNPAIIMENFVLDVSKNTKATPRLTGQFRKIISHYRNIASKHSTDPRLQTLFKHVDRNFSALEKAQNGETEDAEGAEETEDAEAPSNVDKRECAEETECVEGVEETECVEETEGAGNDCENGEEDKEEECTELIDEFVNKFIGIITNTGVGNDINDNNDSNNDEDIDELSNFNKDNDDKF